MFAALAPRLATWFAVFVGSLAGGALALMDAATLSATAATAIHSTAPDSTGTEPTADTSGGVSESPASARDDSSTGVRSVASVERKQAEPAPQAAADDDLIPSPHDFPVQSEADLRKAERLCIRDIPDECVRAADAYRAGVVVPRHAKRASQYQNLAFKAYIRLCESNRPEACYALARMYLRGDGLKGNPAYAKNLMRRVVELCRYKAADICDRLKQEAPMPPKPKRATHQP